MIDTCFTNLCTCTIDSIGRWTMADDPVSECLVFRHSLNGFAIHLPYASSGEFATVNSDCQQWITVKAQHPAHLPGTSGLSKESERIVLIAWATLVAHDPTGAGWYGIKVTEGWAIRNRAASYFLLFSKESNGWIGVFDGERAGALLMSALDPTMNRNRATLDALLGL